MVFLGSIQSPALFQGGSAASHPPPPQVESFQGSVHRLCKYWCLQKGCQQADPGWFFSLGLSWEPGRWDVVLVRWASVATREFEIG
jgi:hypothetical protein